MMCDLQIPEDTAIKIEYRLWLSSHDAREAQKANTWVSNVRRVMGLSEEQAKEQFLKIRPYDK